MTDHDKARQAAKKRDEANRIEREKIKAEQRIRELDSKARNRKTAAAGFVLGSENEHDVHLAMHQRKEAHDTEKEKEELQQEAADMEQEKQQLNQEADTLAAEADTSDH